jgi:hypothetical protein
MSTLSAFSHQVREAHLVEINLTMWEPNVVLGQIKQHSKRDGLDRKCDRVTLDHLFNELPRILASILRCYTDIGTPQWSEFVDTGVLLGPLGQQFRLEIWKPVGSAASQPKAQPRGIDVCDSAKDDVAHNSEPEHGLIKAVQEQVQIFPASQPSLELLALEDLPLEHPFIPRRS